jgi:sulfatase maturation enzyme AslB (radical SAM superfamily)
MCSSAFSSQWRKTDLEMKASGVSFREDTDGHHGGKRVPNNWHLSREKLDEIISLCDENLIQVDIKGGEPLYDKSFEYFVAAIIKKSPKVRISVSTNLTKLTESRLEFIKTIPHINFSLSIDGIGKNY